MTTFEPAVVGQIACCFIMGVIGLSFAAKLFGVRAGSLLVIEAFVVGFLVRLALMFFNESYMLFEHKFAGERSVEFYMKCVAGDGRLIDLFRDQFALQVLVNTPFFAIFDASLMTLIVTNCFVGALSAPTVALLLRGPFGERIARRALILSFIYPASVNFSIFGLRDPLIFFGMSVFVASAAGLYARYSPAFYSLLAVMSCGFVLVLRPELCYVVVALAGMLVLPWLRKTINSEQRTVEKIATVAALTLVVFLGSSALAIASLKVAAMQIGAETINPLAIADEHAEERFLRAESSGRGGNTHLVSAEDYTNMPLYVRIPVQTLGLVVLPFPWMISGVAQLLAFGDSLLLMCLLVLVGRVSFSDRRAAPLAWGLLVAYGVALLGMGVIISNAGNGFRMRFGVVPILLVAGAFCRSIPVFKLQSDE